MIISRFSSGVSCLFSARVKLPGCLLLCSGLAMASLAEEVPLKLNGPKTFAVSRAKSAASGGWMQATLPGSTNIWEFGSDVVLELESGRNAKDWLAKHSPGLKILEEHRPWLVVVAMADPASAMKTATLWAGMDDVLSAYPVCRQPVELNSAFASPPGDDFFPARVANVVGQWYLENRDPGSGERLGADLNARAAWPFSLGRGITVAVGDVGIELAHSELLSALAGSPHRNFAATNSSANPTLAGSTGAHGTSIAGLIAATPDNKIGMSGIAPRAKVASWVVFDSANRIVADNRLAGMYRHASNVVDVQNHSWGPAGDSQQGPTPLESSALDDVFSYGRAGRGSVIVRIAGNRRTLGGNSNDDGRGNDPRAIQVAAIRPDGRAATYSNPGASILVAAPGGDYDTGGLFTTDLSGFAGANLLGFLPPYEYLGDFRFNSLGMIGTSAAAPLVSGAAALMLSANPNLTARDVRHILALSAVQWDVTDPGLETNRAGLRISHNVGFGVVDTGEAVQLALAWTNPLPAAVRLEVEAPTRVFIPDGTLRVEVTGDDIPKGLQSIACLPGLGLHPDRPTAYEPLVDLGLSSGISEVRLDGQGALIERGGPSYATKLDYAFRSGAAFAVIMNYAAGANGDCPPGDQLCPLGGIDFSAIPAVFVGNSDGAGLRELFRTNSTARARLALNPAQIAFAVTNTLRCESVQLRLRTDHPLRGDLRITLVSPSGTRSVLQAYNADESAGPVDWIYSSTHHFLEPTAGTWTLEVADEGVSATGSILGASLILNGVPIEDSDSDGLDDAWERRWFGDLSAEPAADPDEDGWSNAHEAVAGTNPTNRNRPDKSDISEWKPGFARVTFPAKPGEMRAVLTGTTLNSMTNRLETRVFGNEAAVIVPATNSGTRFVRALPVSQ